MIFRAFAFAALLAVPAAANEHPFETDAERAPRLRTGGTCLIRNVTIHSAVGSARVGDVLVRGGKIAAVGSVEAPQGILVLDGTGKHLAPGVIDCHSHMAIDRGINEGTLTITAECDISDALDPDDDGIYRALAGGVTTARLLHGSANAIGGRHEIIKLKWKRSQEELRFPDAKEGIKFALGENPKQSNSGQPTNRFPDSRMGVEAVYERAFTRAREYTAQRQAFEAARARGDDPPPPRRDLRLEVLAGILAGEVDVHSHCYRADEILMLLRAAERFGFKVKTLQHVLEGYKVAKEIADHGAGPSTFSDWWAYKIEAYDAIPHNATLLDEAGAVTSLNSDSDELVRRLYADAAKAIRYGGLDPVRALALVTLNPAKQLAIDARVGSIEAGKDADLALLSGDPLSSLSRVLWTMVDGEIEFERRDAFELETRPPAVLELEEPRRDADVRVEAGAGPVTALVGATLHPITSPDVELGTILIQRGRIVGMGANVTVPGSANVVDLAGRHVWPGMIALHTGLGLIEIGAVRSTDDLGEIGGNQPDLRASASIATDSAYLPVTRAQGVTRAQSGPQSGGPLMGQSCVLRLAGDTWEELVMVDRDQLHVEFPMQANNAKEKKKSEEVKALERVFAEAREYGRLLEESKRTGVSPPSFDPRMEALAPYARGERVVAVHASNAQTILDALAFVKQHKLRAVLMGLSEGWKVADALAEAGLPVAVGPVLALPTSEYDPYDAAYANAAVLARAGLRVALLARDTENTRNLPFHAAMASAFGLPREEALRAVTIYPAQVLGLEQELGSLAPGKVADLVVTDGDLLEIRTHVERVFVDGVEQSLANKQSELYERYRARLRRLQGSEAGR
jgi:imidazolonepropionase-like amidohydrolase